MIEFRVSNLRADRKVITSAADVLIGVSGDLDIVANMTRILSEPDFPVVEFAVEAGEWLQIGLAVGSDSMFDSMSTPEPGWVWRVFTTHGPSPDKAVECTEAVCRAGRRPPRCLTGK